MFTYVNLVPRALRVARRISHAEGPGDEVVPMFMFSDQTVTQGDAVVWNVPVDRSFIDFRLNSGQSVKFRQILL